MSSTNDSTMVTYCHKKFAKHTNKRKHEEMANKENVNSAQTILEEITHQEQPLPKRKQSKALFRPWLEDAEKETQPTKVLQPITPANLTNQFIKQSMQPAKRNRKHLANLIHQYNQQAQQYLLLQQQQYYVYYQQQQVAANLRNTFYQQQLQQMALQQRQNQLFVFGQR